MSRAVEHAITASEFLDDLAKLDAHLQTMSDDERLQMAATGGIARINTDIRWTAELARTYALTSIAMTLAERVQ